MLTPPVLLCSAPFYCRALVDHWIQNKLTLRYSGGLVPDVYHILTKGQVSAPLQGLHFHVIGDSCAGSAG